MALVLYFTIRIKPTKKTIASQTKLFHLCMSRGDEKTRIKNKSKKIGGFLLDVSRKPGSYMVRPALQGKVFNHD